MISIWSDNIVTNVFNYDSEMRNYLNYMMSKNFDGGVKFNFSTPGSTITSLSLTLTYSIYHKTNSFSITKSILSSIPYFTSLLPIPAFIPLYILPHLPTLFITLTLFSISSLLAPLLLLFILTSFSFSISLL